MTIENQTLLKKNLPAWVTFANFVLLLSFVWYQAQWQKHIENKIETFESHTENDSKHTSYLEMSTRFVPRTEVEVKMENIQSILLEIKNDIKKLERQ